MINNTATVDAGPLLDVLYVSACLLADRVERGTLPFIDAVDLIHSAAVWSGLVELVGEDRVSHTMARAFMGVPR